MFIPDNKDELVRHGEEKIKQIQRAYWHGLLTDRERYEQTIKVWNTIKAQVSAEMKTSFSPKNSIYNLIDSGARGDWGNVTQMCGMKGLVASPSGKTIELPIKGNYKEGLSVLEYFINTHSGRKGKADTALKTAQSGYLTRRLVDAAQNILIREEDCGTLQFETITREMSKSVFRESFDDKIKGKHLAKDIMLDGKVFLPAGTLITKENVALINEHQIPEVAVRSILTCETAEGVCQKCYGLDLSSNQVANMGTPVGIIAAQSIGEPGTQLTMRTYHSGGVATQGGDITMGLTRVEELLEARAPKGEAVISELTGQIMAIRYEGQQIIVTIRASDVNHYEYYIPDDTYVVGLKKGTHVEPRQALARSSEHKGKLLSEHSGIITDITKHTIVVSDETPRTIDYTIDASRSLLVKE